MFRFLLLQTCVPLFELIDGWVCNGTLNDPYSEFFIVSHGGVPSERHWFEKYSLRRGMIPSFFTDALVHKILGIGKAVNFIRHNCKDTKYTLEFKGEYKQSKETRWRQQTIGRLPATPQDSDTQSLFS